LVFWYGKKRLNEYGRIYQAATDKCCVISYEMLLAPEYIVKQSGKSKDGKYKGVWFTNLFFFPTALIFFHYSIDSS